MPSPAYLRNKRYRVRHGKRKGGWKLLAAVLLVAMLSTLIFSAPRMVNRTQMHFPAPASERQDEMPRSESYIYPAQRWYVLRLFASQEEAQALSAAQRDRARGAGGYVYPQSGGYAVAAAGYDTREKAAGVQHNLLSYHQVESEVDVWTSPEVHIRMTGTPACLNAIRDGYDFLFALTEQSYACFAALDGGTQVRSDAEMTLLSSMETAQVLRERLLHCFPPESETTSGIFCAQEDLKALLLRLHGAMQRALNEESDVRFGAGVKEVHLMCAHGLVRHALMLEKAGDKEAAEKTLINTP